MPCIGGADCDFAPGGTLASDGATEALNFIPHSSQYSDPSRFSVPQLWHRTITIDLQRLARVLYWGASASVQNRAGAAVGRVGV